MHWVTPEVEFDVVEGDVCPTLLHVACGPLLCGNRWTSSRREVTCPDCLSRIEKRGGARG